MPNDTSIQNIYHLIQKAAEAERSEDAMRYSQAANNAANALIGLSNIDKPLPK